MVKQWEIYFPNCIESPTSPNIFIQCGDIFQTPTDCIVSPANSFGFMDGGLDKFIKRNLGGDKLQKRLQSLIKQQKPNQELLVGEALLVECPDYWKIPFMIAAPTMRVPMILKDTVNVYLATKAAFVLFKNERNVLRDACGGNFRRNITTISICGMGTGIGQVPYDVCAKQMRQAYDDVFLKKNEFPETWGEAQDRHQLLFNNDCMRDLQFEKPE